MCSSCISRLFAHSIFLCEHVFRIRHIQCISLSVLHIKHCIFQETYRNRVVIMFNTLAISLMLQCALTPSVSYMLLHQLPSIGNCIHNVLGSTAPRLLDADVFSIPSCTPSVLPNSNCRSKYKLFWIT